MLAETEPRRPASTRSRRTVVEKRIRLAGYHTRMLEVAGDGPPLVFLHGYADSEDTWRPVMERLNR